MRDGRAGQGSKTGERFGLWHVVGFPLPKPFASRAPVGRPRAAGAPPAPVRHALNEDPWAVGGTTAGGDDGTPDGPGRGKLEVRERAKKKMIRSGSEPTAWGTTRVIGRVSLAASAQARSTAGTDYRSLRPTTALSLQAEQTSDKQPSAARQGKPFARYRAAAVSHWGGKWSLLASVHWGSVCPPVAPTHPPTAHLAAGLLRAPLS